MQKLYLNPVDRDRIRSKWKPRIGQNATDWYVRSRFCTVVAPGIAAIGFVTEVILRTTTDVKGLWLLGPVLIGVAVTVLLVGLALLWYAWRSATKVLGTKVSILFPPPTDDVAYVAWCQGRGLTPFAADQ